MRARIAQDVRLPLKAINHRSVRKELTAKVWDHATQESFEVNPAYSDGVYLHVPRQYGLALAKRLFLDIEDRTSEGFDLPSLPVIQLREGQEPWVDDIVYKFLNRGEYDIMAQAGTGKGKTVMSLEIARRLGATTLILVDQEFLKNQWVERIQQFFGLDKDDIGIVQGPKCDYQDKPFVVAMVQSLYQRTYDSEFYDYFGLVIYDEVHTVGAEQFSKVLMLFSAEYRLGVSATPDRGDALQKLLTWNLGEVSVTLKEEHKQSLVRFVEYEGVVSWYANISPKAGRYLNELAADTRRNVLLAKIIIRLHESGRDVLAVSDRIEHLEHVMAICHYLGLPDESMGMVAGYRNVWKMAKDPTPTRKPEGLEKDADYTPVKLQLLKKRMPKAEMDSVKEHAPVIFATYGMFNKGVDVPRLGAGVDLTPRAKAQQVHGRILRKLKGKLVPIWVTLRDLWSYKAEYQFEKRLGEYRKSNAEIEQWHLTKGKRSVDVSALAGSVRQRHQELKEMKIVTGQDGNNIIVIPSTGRQQRSGAGKATAKPTRRRRQRQS